MSRGRPSEQIEKPEKMVLEFEDSIWHYDINKNPNGAWKVEQKFKPGEKHPEPEINARPYGKLPVVMVFKTSNRSNAKTKMKVFRKNIDYIISGVKLPGVPEKAEILELGIGSSFIDKWKKKYKLK